MAKIIYVIDDDEDIRLTLTELLEDEGYTVRSFQDGSEALKVLRGADFLMPDLILVDLMMPKVDGHEFCAEISKDRKFDSTPVVIMSAQVISESSLSPRFSGNHIRKPINMRDFLIRVSRLLEKSWEQ